MLRPAVVAAAAVGLASACTAEDRNDEGGASGPGGIDTGIDSGVDSGGDTAGSGDGDGDGPRLDAFVGDGGGDPDCGQESGQCGVCEIQEHTPCDGGPNPTFGQAMGLGCPGEQPIVPTFSGNSGAIGLRQNFGNAGAFPPQEGSRFVVIGSGFVNELDSPNTNDGTAFCDDNLGNFNPGATLPAPIRTNNVAGDTCDIDPAGVGTGDCSNTIQAQFQAGGAANDYTELRFTTQVPSTASSFSYDFAFFSVEYPRYFGSQFNDMYIGWLESMNWTGNISFDEQGNPISLNAGFLDYKDATQGPGAYPITGTPDPDCPAAGGCTAVELHGTCMQSHAGTKWLSTQAPVVPGETITVVFAVFDLSDSALDSYVFLDNFQWGCEGDSPPSTAPVG